MARQPRVTLREPGAAPATPSQELIANALQEEVLTDAKGRKLLMRKPSPLAQFRILEAVGPETAANQTYMQMIQPLLYLGAIDDAVVVLPQTKLELEALITRLDDDGLNSVMSWYVANVAMPSHNAIEAAVKAATDKAALKN